MTTNLPTIPTTTDLAALMTSAASLIDGKLSDATRCAYAKGIFAAGLTHMNGRQLLALVHLVAAIHQKWQGNRNVANRVYPMGTEPARRDDLGDLDSDQWERDKNGVPRDPWSLVYVLPLLDQKTGEEFVFHTRSHGGRGAIAKLMRASARKRHLGLLPIVSLETDSYKHESFGKIDVPVFKVVEWIDDGQPKVERTQFGSTSKRADDPISSGITKIAPPKELNDEIAY